MAKELLPENEKFLNQLSKKALKELKVNPEPNDLYVVQLMLWVLRERRDQFNRTNWPDLLEVAEYLECHDQKKMWELLLQEDEQGDALFPESDDLKELDPEDLAFHLVEHLHLWLGRDDLGYPTKILQAVYPMT